MTESLHPFATAPHLVDKVWGGTRLAPDDKRPIGEAWLVADLEQGTSTTKSGTALRALMENEGPRLGARDDGRFPLLVKLIDAAKDLSIQVHPDDTVASTIAGATSKDETWIITGTKAGASVLCGLRDNVTRDDFMNALAKRRPEKVMKRIPVYTGDVLRVAPGTVHAICGGVALLEVQEPSDTTFRVWDYERPGLDGELRPLHKEEALASIHFENAVPASVVPEVRFEHGRVAHEVLVQAPGYRIERVSSGGQSRWRLPTGPVRVVVPLTHSAQIGEGDDALTVEAQAAAVVPAGWTGPMRCQGDVIISSPACSTDLVAVEVDR